MQPPASSRRRLSPPRLEGNRESRAIATRLGGELHDGRLRAKLKQVQVADLIGVHQSRVSQIERGLGHAAPLAVWIAFGVAVRRPLAVVVSRSLIAEPRDAGHLGAQELILRLAKA